MRKRIQSQGVIATAKQFVCSDHETDRHACSSKVHERTLQEVYYQPFRAAVEASVGAVMASDSTFRTDDVDIEQTRDTGGGYDIRQVAPGEWLQHTVNVPGPSVFYRIKAHVAPTVAGPMRVQLDGTVTGCR